MRGLYRAGTAALMALLAVGAHAQAASPEPAASQTEAPPKPAPKFEGAVGLLLSSNTAFSGSSQREIKPELAGFIRYGRFTLSGAGGFTTRQRDDVERGLDAELLRRDTLRVDLALRYDPGRRESASEQLAGMGDIKATLRARLGLRWRPGPQWTLSLNGSLDALGNGGGYLVDAGLSRSFTLDARQRFILGASLAAAGERYLQTWYGVTPEQSARSGYAVYTPGAGLRDLRASATWRIEIDPQWAGFASVGATRLLGPAAASPLTRQPGSVSLTAGIARRF